ncbi:MAG: Ig domain-containing protein, partial [Lentihominibacter sp.]
IPAKGHRYVEGADAEFIWSKDYTSAQVGCPCADCDYIKPVSIPADDITHEVTAEPTYTSEGEETYTASYTDENGVTYSDTKTLAIPKLNAEASLTKTSVSVYAGDKVTVSLTSKYSADVITGCKTADTTYSSASLSSSKKSVTITGKKAGKTTVAITTASNETVKLTVTVTAPPSEATVAKDIAKAEGNISGAVFARLSARTSSVKNTSITLKWNSVSTADGYIVYGNKCGTKYKFKKLATVKGSSKVTYTHKNLSKGTYYKYIVLAYKNVNGKKVIISKAKTLHVVTGGSKTYANASSVKPAKTSVSVTKGKTTTLKATTVLPKGKKAKVHRSLAFESSNTQIATVTSKGVITGKKAGTCYVYVYAQNGKYYKVKVTVK